MPDEIVFSVCAAPGGGFQAWTKDYPIYVTAETIDALKANIESEVRSRFAQNQTLPSIRMIDAPPKTRFRFGTAKGEFTVPDDFNDPLPKEIEDLFYK